MKVFLVMCPKPRQRGVDGCIDMGSAVTCGMYECERVRPRTGQSQG